MNNSYIYAIKGNGLTYYGSSTQPLCERKSSHITTHRYYKKTGKLDKCCQSYLIFDSCDDWIIEKVEELPENTTQEELLLRENYYIKNFDCVNKNLAIRTKEEHREYQRQWAENDRRAKGIPEKKIGFDNYAYQKEWRKQKMEKMTPEEKEKLLEHNRDRYSKREITEEQRERSKERARKQREAINADPEKLAQLKEYKKQKAKEYREKKEQEI